MANTLKTTLLLGALSGLLIGLGYMLGGPSMALVFLVLAGVMNFSAYWFSDKMALSMAGAHEVSMQEAPELHAIVQEVADLSGMPKPKVFIIDNESPNAFATGRNPEHAVVAATSGIMRILDRRELRAVIGHEMGHVKNRDILTSSIAATLAGAISYIGTMFLWFGGIFGDRRDSSNMIVGLLAAIFAPMAALILQMAISRTREYQADRSGAEYTHDPEALASALAKLHNGVQVQPMPTTAGTQATSALYIVHPFRMDGGLAGLFSTHPPIEERIRRLRAMAGIAE